MFLSDQIFTASPSPSPYEYTANAAAQVHAPAIVTGRAAADTTLFSAVSASAIKVPLPVEHSVKSCVLHVRKDKSVDIVR